MAAAQPATKIYETPTSVAVAKELGARPLFIAQSSRKIVVRLAKIWPYNVMTIILGEPYFRSAQAITVQKRTT